MASGRNVCHIAAEKDSCTQVCLPLQECGHLRPAGGDGELQGLCPPLVGQKWIETASLQFKNKQTNYTTTTTKIKPKKPSYSGIRVFKS